MRGRSRASGSGSGTSARRPGQPSPGGIPRPPFVLSPAAATRPPSRPRGQAPLEDRPLEEVRPARLAADDQVLPAVAVPVNQPAPRLPPLPTPSPPASL